MYDLASGSAPPLAEATAKPSKAQCRAVLVHQPAMLGHIHITFLAGTHYLAGVGVIAQPEAIESLVDNIYISGTGQS